MKRLAMAVPLALTLCVPVLAGDMPTGGIAPPPPTPASTPAPGDIPSSGIADLSTDALSALLSALGFLVA